MGLLRGAWGLIAGLGKGTLAWGAGALGIEAITNGNDGNGGTVTDLGRGVAEAGVKEASAVQGINAAWDAMANARAGIVGFASGTLAGLCDLIAHLTGSQMFANWADSLSSFQIANEDRIHSQRTASRANSPMEDGVVNSITTGIGNAVTENPGTTAALGATALGATALLKGRTPPLIDGTRGGLRGALFGRTRWGKLLRVGAAVVGAGAVLANRAEGAELPEDASLSEQFVAAANESGLTETVIQAVPFADATRTAIEDGGLSEDAVDSAVIDGTSLAGGLTGAWAGAAGGAAIGSFVPIIGTGIGGAIGGFVGYIAGEMAGNYAGETLTENFNAVASGENAQAEAAYYASPEATKYYANNFQLGG